jgi:hypothetical protein
MRIEVLIDEVVLHGFEPHQRHTLGDGLAEELARLLTADVATWGRPRAVDVERVWSPRVRLDSGGAAAPVLAAAVRAAIGTAVAGPEVRR